METGITDPGRGDLTDFVRNVLGLEARSRRPGSAVSVDFQGYLELMDRFSQGGTCLRVVRGRTGQRPELALGIPQLQDRIAKDLVGPRRTTR